MIITIANIKGGCSKTTTAIALASAAVKAKLSTRLIDTDPQGSASEWGYVAKDNNNELPFEIQSCNQHDVKRLELKDDEWIIIDTPPSGNIVDDAVKISDFVIVPVTPSSIEMRQTWPTIQALQNQDKPYAVLITKTNVITKAYKSILRALNDEKVCYFSTTIPAREDIKNTFGRQFKRLYGYDKVLKELRDVFKK